MANPLIQIYNAETGETIVREMNDVEFAGWQANQSSRDADQAKDVRNDRNKRLADCDWTQLPDSPVDKAAWSAYRQKLRDLTKADGFPWEITWPVQP
jgi:hypothetical protein